MSDRCHNAFFFAFNSCSTGSVKMVIGSFLLRIPPSVLDWSFNATKKEMMGQ